MVDNFNSGSSGLAVIAIDNLRLVLPQNQILTLDPVEDMALQTGESGMAGLISTEEGKLPTYYLNDGIKVGKFKTGRRIVIALANEQNPYAILADELAMLDPEQVGWKKKPRAVYSEQTPVLQVAILDKRLICLTSASILYDTTIVPGECGSNQAA